jgi:hypothetical protein
MAYSHITKKEPMHSRIRLTGLPALAVAAAVAISACGSSSSSSTTSASPSSTASSGGAATTASSAASGPKVDLAGVCPSTVTIQTDWNPEADHGSTYEMLGPNPTINTKQKSVTSDLYANGQPTGVKLQIRAGGPAIGYSTVSAEMYEDKSITLGYVNTDESIEYSGKLPTTAVFAENNISPQIIMWDPKTYSSVSTIKQLGQALPANKGVVYYFSGAAYMDYLTGAGYLTSKQTDGSYSGTPAQFVEAQGHDAQQGFATAEPYIYSHEVQAWDKPLKYQLIYDTGWQPYPEPLSVRTGDLAKLTPCLKKLVPVLQQADVDYLKSPTATNTLVDTLVNDYNNGWTYDAKVGAYAAGMMNNLEKQQSIPYVGYMDSARITKLIGQAKPIFASTKGAAIKSGLVAGDVFTDKFMSTKIAP